MTNGATEETAKQTPTADKDEAQAVAERKRADDDLQQYRGNRRLRRVKMSLSVHPETVDRLAALGMKYSMSRGMLVDKLVLTLRKEIKTGTCHCVHGERCRFDRTDSAGEL